MGTVPSVTNEVATNSIQYLMSIYEIIWITLITHIGLASLRVLYSINH